MNIMLIGLGNHAKRIHIPTIKALKSEYNLKIKVIVELNHEIEHTRNFIQSDQFLSGCSPEIIPITPENIDFRLSKSDQEKIHLAVDANNINVVIISSDPLSHFAYLDFAFRNNIYSFVDKPIVISPNACLSEKAAISIYSKYLDLKSIYNDTNFCTCLSQRRYHPAILYITDKINEIYRYTKFPVNAINFHYSDGQWRMPNEIRDENYHGYHNGLGMLSHSGYHFIDIISQFLECNKDFQYDKISAYVSNTYPDDYFGQIRDINQSDFSNSFFKLDEHSIKDSVDNASNFGEMDSHINFTFYSNAKKITNVNLNLLHNGVSQRAWEIPKVDLYKGNGRIRHETYIINQGPFQTIYYNSYQSTEISDKNNIDNDRTGGVKHSEVSVFRNLNIFKHKTLFERRSFGNEGLQVLQGYSGGHQENSRAACLKDFLDAITGRICSNNAKSCFSSHEQSTLLISLACFAAAKENANNPPYALWTQNKGFE